MSSPPSAPTREAHPWNEGFLWRDHEGPFTTITTAQAEAFDRDGCFVLESVFTTEECAAIDAAIEPGVANVRELLEHLPGGRFSVAGLDTQIVAPHVATTSAVLRAACAHPTLVGACRDLMGPDVRLYWEQAVYKQPDGAAPVLWHQDNGYTYVEPQDYLTCWIALTDATPENGCVRVVPGAHRDGTLAHRDTPLGFECWGDEDLAVEVPVRAGDVVVFSSLTPHATGANRTSEVRKAYIVQYAHAGAVGHQPTAEGRRGPADPLDHPVRQFPVLVDGAAVEPPAL